MGLILDHDSSKLYESWTKSKHGRVIDRMVEECVFTLLDPKPGERVLDIGCGDGNHLLMFNRMGLDISGIDASAYMINRAKERLGKKCILKTGMAEDLPFDDNEFDIAVLINTLEFLDDPVDALIEAGRVARRKVFVGALNSCSWFGVNKRFHGYFCKSIFRNIRFYSLWELKSYMKKAFGEVPIQWKCARVNPPLLTGTGMPSSEGGRFSRCPFGSFLGLSATMHYRLRTEQHPLEVTLGRIGV